MNLLGNSMHFKINAEADVEFNAEKQMKLLLWVSAVGVTQIRLDGTRMAPAIYPIGLQVGSWYYYLLKDKQLEHVRGMEYFQHYIIKPLAWLDEVYDTKSIDIVDEDTGEVTKGTTDILNKDYFRIGKKNVTHVLVRVEDNKFAECLDLIEYVELEVFNTVGMMPTNTLCSDKYDRAIKKPVLDKKSGKMVGGEFYVEPIDIEE